MKINKNNIIKFVNTSNLKELSDQKIIECFLVADATKVSEEMSNILYLEMMNRNICFSEFFYFAKFKWSTSYLIMLSTNESKDVKNFVYTFDSYNTSYGKNTAPRQKGRVIARLYSIFYNKHDFNRISIQDAENLFQLIIEKYECFRGDRNKTDNDLTRNDLYGVVAFLRTIFQSNGEVIPPNYLEDIIPSSLIKSKGVVASRSKVKSFGRQDNYFTYELLVNIHEKYIDLLILKTQKRQGAALYNLLDFVEKRLQVESIRTVNELKELLSIGRSGHFRFLHYLENTVKSGVKAKATYIRDMMVWAMNEYDIDPEHGFEPLFDNFEWDRIQRDKVYRNTTSFGRDETPKAVIPMRVHQLAIDILCDPDYKWSRTLEDQYFHNEKSEKVFNPTLTNLLALVFQVPIRAIQAQVLDSGEGDEHRYDYTKLCWVKNDSNHAGYWKSKTSVNPNRGFLKRDMSLVKEAVQAHFTGEDGYPIVKQAYMYINTNKTADRSVEYSDVSGYTIPWHHVEAISIYSRQLNFIKKHHPIASPSAINMLSRPQTILGGKPTKAALDIIPERFYLFRCNLNPDHKSRDFPPTKQWITKMWNHLMLEIQRRLNEEGADFSIISKDKFNKFMHNIGGGNSYISYLTPHCTRVTGITRLEEHGVPVDIISKLIAGHANIRTTYRYIKHEKSYVNDRISEAQAKINEKLELALTNNLKSSNLEKAQSIAYIPDIYSTSWDKMRGRSWNSNVLGICPNASTLCEEGHEGMEIEFNGVGRCLNCKFLISGKPYLINIWNHVNLLLYRAKELNDEYTTLQTDYKELIRSRAMEFNINGRSHEWININSKVNKVEGCMGMNSENVNVTLTEVYYGNLLFENIRQLTNTEDDFVEGLGFEECSNFEHLNSVVESESYLPYFQRHKNLSFKRDVFVDRALMAIGEQPIFLRNLTSNEKEKAISSTARMIESDIKRREGMFFGVTLKLDSLMENCHAE
ncbi:VPA1269 family protein [Aeromonas hydrophila]|uniref:VPA1269 family protein n=1 Tax=Aeromonas hydrophila TaxID=644 RepID=UPI001364C70A|nr:VPA1269 family protein [Aeromonas hydrophila]